MTVTINSIDILRNTLKELRGKQKIALVPTMGNLHEGHLSLVNLAKQHADIVVVSIFVNPTQFGAGEDLDSYPRTLDEDTEKLTQAKVDFIFAPSVPEMYPVMPPPTQVLTGSISQLLCGKSRPTHFDGVGIVVTKLFNIVQPEIAVFGKKDYQQLAIIRQLVRDLSYDIQILGGPIIRAEDGLALSSRNQYLMAEERAIAPSLQKNLQTLSEKLAAGHANTLENLDNLVAETIESIESLGFNVDYLQVLNQDLSEITEFDGQNRWVVAVAAWLGKARLLDNSEVSVSFTN